MWSHSPTALYGQVGIFIGAMSVIAIQNEQTTSVMMAGVSVVRDYELSLYELLLIWRYSYYSSFVNNGVDR